MKRIIVFLILVLLGLGVFNSYALDNEDVITDTPLDHNGQVIHPLIAADQISGEYSVLYMFDGKLYVRVPEGVYVSSVSQCNIFGYNGTTWEEVKIDENKEFVVVLSSISDNGVEVGSITSSSNTAKFLTYFGEALPTGSNIIGAVTQSGTWDSTETVKDISTSRITVSSSTATLLLASNTNRSTLEINLTLSDYDIVIATYALTTTDEGFPIASGTVWTPERRITEQLYSLAFTGDADVRIAEYPPLF